jgi:hypothetical protein
MARGQSLAAIAADMVNGRFEARAFAMYVRIDTLFVDTALDDDSGSRCFGRKLQLSAG